MSINYRIVIKNLTTTKTELLNDVISHIHFDYVGTNENNVSAFCQGIIPFQIHEYSYVNPSTNKTVTVPSILNGDSFINYDDITKEMIVSWVNEHLPASAVTTYQEIISKKLNDSYQPKSSLPWQ
jgi:hypothetical protein